MSKNHHHPTGKSKQGGNMKSVMVSIFATCTAFLAVAVYLQATSRMVVNMNGIEYVELRKDKTEERETAAADLFAPKGRR